MEPWVLTGVGELITNDEERPGLLGIIPDATVVLDDRVLWAGPENELPATWSGARRIDVNGRAVLPAFVDAHTHLVFAGDRSDEFSRRMAGESYQAIAAEGGGILATVA